jgi:hypothetical protein
VSLENKKLPVQMGRKKEEDGTEGVLFVQQLRTKEQTENVASVRNGCARTTLSRQFIQDVTIARNNHNTDKYHSHFCSKLYFIVHIT